MSTLSSANVTDVNLVLKERTHMRLCRNMLIFTHNLGNWLIWSLFTMSTPSRSDELKVTYSRQTRKRFFSDGMSMPVAVRSLFPRSSSV